LLLAAAREWHVSLRASFLVGDSPKDIAAGRAAGCRTILVGRKLGARAPRAAAVAPAKPRSAKPDARAADLPRAAAWILAKLGRNARRNARTSAAEARA
jgi:beta-phosphoglucomutase-like phosphatase (HAD superfamily)